MDSRVHVLEGGDFARFLDFMGSSSRAQKMAEDGVAASEILFTCLPDPKNDPYLVMYAAQSNDAAGQPGAPRCMMLQSELLAALKGFVKAIDRGNPTDSDAKFLEQTAREVSMGQPPKDFVLALARLGMMMGDSLTDANNSDKKAQHLAYYRWLVLGRKDENSPLKDAKPTSAPVSHAYLPTGNAHRTCANCGKDGATQACTGCLVQHDGHAIFRTGYCGKACQAADWENHKSDCRDLMRLERATSLLQEIIVCFLKNVYGGDDISEISSTKDFVVARYKSKNTGYTGEPVLHSFPMAAASSTEAALATMMTMECDNIMTTFKDVFDMFFSGAVKSIKIVNFSPKNMERPVKSGYGDGEVLESFNSIHNHTVLLLTTTGGLDIAFDPTGAQFGWKETITPWKVYSEQRVHRVVTVQPFKDIQSTKQLKEFYKLQGAFMGVAGTDVVCREVEKEAKITEDLIVKIKSSLREFPNKGEFHELLLLDGKAFSDLRMLIMARAKTVIVGTASEWDSSPLDRLYRDHHLVTQYTTSQEQYDKLKKVWFSKEQYERLQNNPAELKLQWLKRLRQAGIPTGFSQRS